MEDYKPFVALNVYLVTPFRQEILAKVVDNLSALPDEQRRLLVDNVKEYVRISGFRNPFAAPQSLLLRKMEQPFEQDSRFLKQVLAAWVLINQELQPAVATALESWTFEKNDQAPVYPDPENAFLIGWPNGLSYEKLEEGVRKQGANITASRDEIALMTIFTTGCLPNPLSAGE
ncbi:MAG: hypothetical protein WA110_01640 [Anaerolineaceae bacterium]